MNEILITICARGGSKGIPGKNIKRLNGKPLISYTIQNAFSFSNKYKADIELSTDSSTIKRIAEKYGLHTKYLRPVKLASDTAGKIEVIKHILEYSEKKNNKKYDFIIDLDVTSPLRNYDDLNNAFKQLNTNKEALNIFSVSPAKRNPYFNMIERNDEGFVILVKNIGIIKSRQTAPKVYDMNASFYIYKRKFFELGYQISVTDKSIAYVVPHVCFDLDETEDFIIMEIMLRENLLDFQL